jgi:hypothetical protein
MKAIEGILEEARGVYVGYGTSDRFNKLTSLIDQALALSREKCVWKKRAGFENEYYMGCYNFKQITCTLGQSFKYCPMCNKEIEEVK